MSSLRNSIQRRSHRERGQLKEREKLGLLEKHKDYSLRAKDHKKKQTVLKSLKQKAAERNEDEFYFGMVSRQAGKKFSSGALSNLSTAKHNKKWTGTVAGDRGNKAMDVDTVRLLKTQDIGYLRTVRNIVAKEVKDLEERAVVAGAFAGVDVSNKNVLNDDDEDDDDFDSDEEDAPRKSKPRATKPNKVVFADSMEEVDEILPSDQQADEHDEDMDSDAAASPEPGSSGQKKDPQARKRQENAERLLRKLRTTRKKLKALTAAENELELQRARMAKTATVGGITKSGKKIKIRERKR